LEIEYENKKREYLEVAKKCAIIAGKYLSKNFMLKHKIMFKSEKDVGLAIDRESEKMILEIILSNYPNHNIYSEEIGRQNNNSNYTWFIDPLDGTNNYAAGIPYFSVSIALMHKNEIIVGVVYNPIAKQLFEAIKGEGAFFNGEKILISQNKKLSSSICSFVQGHLVVSSDKLDLHAKTIRNKVSEECRRVISTWAPALDWALLAFGGIDVLISFESELEDLYAGLLIASEAGAEIINFNKDCFKIGEKRIIASNKYLASRIAELIN
jgi:myo-inositol-1(or 4)-monophosphatase